MTELGHTHTQSNLVYSSEHFLKRGKHRNLPSAATEWKNYPRSPHVALGSHLAPTTPPIPARQLQPGPSHPTFRYFYLQLCLLQHELSYTQSFLCQYCVRRAQMKHSRVVTHGPNLLSNPQGLVVWSQRERFHIAPHPTKEIPD